MDLRQFLGTMRRHWKLVLVVFLLGVGGASAVTASTTPLYASTARLFVGTSAGARVAPYAGAPFSHQRATAYADLAQHSPALQPVIDKLVLGRPPDGLPTQLPTHRPPDSVPRAICAIPPNTYL